MKRLIVLLVLLVPLTSAAAKKTWWGRFCERHLIAADPYQYEPIMVMMRDDSPTYEAFISKLVTRYRDYAVQLYWRRSQLNEETLRIYLRTIGAELRRSQGNTPRADVEDILELYSKFERESP